jgi:threonine/homoserine/homoserine lactone efflux protein
MQADHARRHHLPDQDAAAGSPIAGVLASFCLASVAIWAGFGAAISRFLASPGARATFNWTMAAQLVVSLVPVLW